AYYSPASAAIRMAQAYLLDKKEILPSAALLEGEYGYRDVYAGVPVRIGAGGVEEVIQLDLTEKEKSEFAVSVSHVQELVGAMDKVLAAKS
ncbi:MAG: malate dehydrogenase, partial [Candidatus Binatia bacterium]